MDNKDKITFLENPIEVAIENEVARCSAEGFDASAKCLMAALKLLKKAEAEEYDQWRIEQGAGGRGFN